MADVSSTLDAWSTTAGSNNPSGSVVIGSGLDDNLRQMQAVVRLLASPNSIASATTTDLSTVNDTFITVSGTTTITGLGTVTSGIYKYLIFSGILTLTHNGTSLILPGAANITTAAGDIALMLSLGSGNWRCLSYTRAATAPAAISAAQTFLGSDVALNNISNYFNVCNTGSIGAAGQVWKISAVLAALDTAGTAVILGRIWDGSSTVYVETPALTASSSAAGAAIYIAAIVTLSAATTFHLSAKDTTSTSGIAKTTGGAGTANKATWIMAERIS